MNMLLSRNLPKGIKIRKNFTFRFGEKDPLNFLYRHLVDRWLKSRFQCTDYFDSINPIDSERLKRLVSLSKSFDVELMLHMGVDKEYRYLLGKDWANLISDTIQQEHL